MSSIASWRARACTSAGAWPRAQLPGSTTSASSASGPAGATSTGGPDGDGARRQAPVPSATTTIPASAMLFSRARMRIGDIELNPGALLAPMEAVTDLPFRTICEELGAALTFTEFLSAEALTRGAAKAIGRMWPSLQGRRFAVQIFGREPEALA